MAIPLISKKQFNRFRAHLPVPSKAEKILGIVVISCAIWVFKHGRAWSDIPKIYGKYDTIRKRFSRWSKSGKFRDVFNSLAAKLGKNNIAIIDSTFVKAHRTSASMKSDNLPRKIGKSAGGLTTKIHLLANIEKIPLDFSLTEGNEHDLVEGKKLIIKNIRCIKKLLADRAYDAASIRNELNVKRKECCIPPKSNKNNPEKYDEVLYRERSKIENMFSVLKDWRGIAMRYCRSAHMFDSAVCIALITLFFNVR